MLFRPVTPEAEGSSPFRSASISSAVIPSSFGLLRFSLFPCLLATDMAAYSLFCPLLKPCARIWIFCRMLAQGFFYPKKILGEMPSCSLRPLGYRGGFRHVR